MKYDTKLLKKQVECLKISLKDFKFSIIKERILQKDNKYDTEQGKNLINNVWYLRTANMRITELLEQVATDLGVIDQTID